AYSTNAAPMLCVTVGDMTPSSPSQTKPSINWCTAKNVGSAANSNSRLCFTFVNVAIPTAPSTQLPTKFAVAEKHTFATSVLPGCANNADHTRLRTPRDVPD